MKRVVHVDGASRGNPGPAAIGVVITDAHWKVLEEIGEYIGEATNNVAEYRALIRALGAALAQGATEVEIRTDSELLVQQVQGGYKVRSPALRPLFEEVTGLLRQVRRWTIQRVPREANARADLLANHAIDATIARDWAEYSVVFKEGPRGVRAVVPALPGVEARASSRAEALKQVRARAEEHLRKLRARGEPWPREERIRIRPED